MLQPIRSRSGRRSYIYTTEDSGSMTRSTLAILMASLPMTLLLVAVVLGLNLPKPDQYKHVFTGALVGTELRSLCTDCTDGQFSYHDGRIDFTPVEACNHFKGVPVDVLYIVHHAAGDSPVYAGSGDNILHMFCTPTTFGTNSP